MTTKAKVKAALLAAGLTASGMASMQAQTVSRDDSKIGTTQMASDTQQNVVLNASDLVQVLGSVEIFQEIMATKPELGETLGEKFFEAVNKNGTKQKGGVALSAQGLEKSLLDVGFNREEIQPAMESFFEKSGVHVADFGAYRQDVKKDFESWRQETNSGYENLKKEMKSDAQKATPGIQPMETGLDLEMGVLELNGKTTSYVIDASGDFSFSEDVAVSGNATYLMPSVYRLDDGSYQCGPLQDEDKGFLLQQANLLLKDIKLEHEAYKEISARSNKSFYAQKFCRSHEENLKDWGLTIDKKGNLHQSDPRVSPMQAHSQGR